MKYSSGKILIFYRLLLIIIFSIVPLGCSTETEPPVSENNKDSSSSRTSSNSSPESKDNFSTQNNQNNQKSEGIKEEEKKTNNLEQVQIQELVHFDFDSSSLTPDAQNLLKQVSLKLLDNASQIIIAGHADERGADDYNLRLGRQRAESVKDFLITFGINPELLSTVSYGETKPLVLGSHQEAWDQNRRVEFISAETQISTQTKTNIESSSDLLPIHNFVYFDFDSNILSAATKRELKQVYSQLKEAPRPIKIIGHTDRIGSDEYNFDLGLKRAEIVKDFLAIQGLNPALISTVSYGETKPVVKNSLKISSSQNRRVEIITIAGSQASISSNLQAK